MALGAVGVGSGFGETIADGTEDIARAVSTWTIGTVGCICAVSIGADWV
jgi:hypothetical protein